MTGLWINPHHHTKETPDGQEPEPEIETHPGSLKGSALREDPEGETARTEPDQPAGGSEGGGNLETPGQGTPVSEFAGTTLSEPPTGTKPKVWVSGNASK